MNLYLRRAVFVLLVLGTAQLRNTFASCVRGKSRPIAMGLMLLMLLGGIEFRGGPRDAAASPDVSSLPADPAAFAAQSGVTFYLPWEYGKVWKITWDRFGDHHDVGPYASYNRNAFDAVPDPSGLGRGTPRVTAAAAGTVYAARNSVPGFSSDISLSAGNCVVIRHDDGTFTQYAHLKYNTIPQSIMNAKANGSRISSGTVLGEYGATGNANGAHLHFSRLSNASANCTGTSIDIVFSDSDAELRQDGGRPKQNRYYASDNQSGPSCSSQPLQIATGLSITGTRQVGSTLTASFSVRNANPAGCAAYNAQYLGAGGRGPGGQSDIQDFPLVGSVSIAPGQTYNYQASKAFGAAGNYGFNIYALNTTFGNPSNLTKSVSVSLTSCSTVSLSVSSALTVTPTNIYSGQTVTAKATITNTGCADFVGTLYTGGRGPGGESDNQDFPRVANVRIPKNGGTYTYQQTKTLTTVGTYNFTMGGLNSSGGWFEIPAGSGSNKATMRVVLSETPGTVNPAFSGVQLPITNCVDSPNTGTACRVRDGNATSNWAMHGTPSVAVVTLDLGSVKSLTGIKWQFTYTGYADQFEVRTSTTYGGATTSLGTFGNGTASRTWFGKGTTSSARFVQFVFRNPMGDPAVGSVGEIQVWGKPPTVSNPPGTRNPTMTGSKATVSNAFDSSNTGTARRVLDGANWSNFSSGVGATTITLTLDLGTVTPLSGVRWMWTSIGYGDEFQVRVSSMYGGAFISLGTFGNGTSTGTWFGVPTSASARFVQFVFTNPNVDPALGALGEVEIWKKGAAVNPPGTANPSVSGVSRHTFTNIFSSPTSSTARNVADGVTWTNWASPATTPSSATLTMDMGVAQPVKVLRWQMPNVGYADQFTVRIGTTYGNWTTLGTFGNPGAKYAWYGIVLSGSPDVRFVQLVFANPNRDVALGAIGEFEAWGSSGIVSAAGSSDPDLAGQPLPLTCAAVPTSASVPNACDADGGTVWQTDPTTPQQVVLTITLPEAVPVSGIKWNVAQSGMAEQFTVAYVNEGTVNEIGTFTGGQPGAYEGVALPDEPVADHIVLTFPNVNSVPALGGLAEIEVWSTWTLDEATPQAVDATPQAVDATPDASPAAAEPETPATPEPVTEESLDATPEPVTEESTEDVTPTADIASPAPANDVPTSEPTVEPTATVTEIAEPTATELLAETPEPTATVESTAVPTETPQPTAAVSSGVIIGTDGDLVNCRVSPVDGDSISQVAEGDQIDVTGPAVDGWLPVLCEGQPGFIAEEFVSIGGDLPAEPTATEPVDGDVTATTEPTEDTTEEATDEAIEEPTAEPEETPYPVYDTGDTENSGAAWLASDGDIGSYWSVYPGISPEQTRLYLDLGSVLPIDRLTIELAHAGMLPYFEIWLSEDADTWYNVTPGGINGWDLWTGEAIPFSLGYDARYIRLVIPNVHESGLSEVGGIAEIEVWPGNINQTRFISSLGAPTTPTPAPEPTPEPTAEPPEELVEEVIEESTEEDFEQLPVEGDVSNEDPVEVFPTEEPATVPVWEEPVATEAPVPGEESDESVG